MAATTVLGKVNLSEKFEEVLSGTGTLQIEDLFIKVEPSAKTGTPRNRRYIKFREINEPVRVSMGTLNQVKEVVNMETGELPSSWRIGQFGLFDTEDL